MEQKQSVLGIVSFVISIIFSIYIVVFWFVPTDLGAISFYKSDMFISFLGCATPLMFIVALVLGIRGILQKGRRKLFAMLGTIISAIAIILYSVLYIYLINE